MEKRRRIVDLLVLPALAATVATAACSSSGSAPSSPVGQVSSPTAQAAPAPTAFPSAPVATPPQQLYRDADFGWQVAIPSGWIELRAAGTRQEKYFVTNDPKIDPNQLGFNIQPGDGIFSVLVGATPATPPSACITPQQNPGQTTAPTTIDGTPTTIYHWMPPSDHDSYYLYAVGNGHCYRLTWDFAATAASDQQTVAAILSSFRFGP